MKECRPWKGDVLEKVTSNKSPTSSGVKTVGFSDSLPMVGDEKEKAKRQEVEKEKQEDEEKEKERARAEESDSDNSEGYEEDEDNFLE